MNFIEELKWRNMLHDTTPGVDELLSEGKQIAYIGFDPTAPSITIGNYVQIMLLNLWQRCGNQPIVLMGGATGRIGDPSGKDKERDLKSTDELDANLARQVEQMKTMLDFDHPTSPAILVNNHDFYKEMNVLTFLRDVGKTLTVNYMSSKDSVKNRLETGLSFTEFSYQLLQAYDFQCLYDQYDCKVQMGGSDQWGNILSGTEFIRRNVQGKAYAITTPLLTKSDGKKFGKSEAGNIWMDGNMTTPYQFYQFWLNADDADIPKFIRYFTFKSKEEVEALEAEHADNPRAIKQVLAEELTIRIHGQDSYESVMQVSDLLFNKKADHDFLKSMSTSALKSVAGEIPHFEVSKSLVSSPLLFIDLLTEYTEILPSKAEAKRAIKGNALSINKLKINTEEHVITPQDLLHAEYLMLENGKKNKYIISFV